MKEIEGFQLTLETAMEFYKLCAEKKLTTMEERTALLREFVKNKQAIYHRNAMKMLDGKNVVEIKYKRNPK